MKKLKRLVKAFMAFTLLLGSCGAGKQTSPRGTTSCSALPPKLTFSRNDTLWTYQPQEASLDLAFDNYLFFSQDWCSIKNEEDNYYPFFKVDLISTVKRRKLDNANLKSREAVRERCRKLKKGSYIQSSAILHVNKTKHTFHYVQVIILLYILKFIYSEKATKVCEISTLLFSYVVPVKSKVEISQNFVAFSEYMNFKIRLQRALQLDF